MESFSELHGICLSVFSAISKTTSVFIIPLFMGRIVFSNIVGEGSKVFELIKGVVIYFCLVSGFPLIMDLLFSIPEAYLPRYDSMNSFLDESPSGMTAGFIPFALDRILEVVLASLYWVVYYLHIFFMLVMCSMAPIVFLGSTLLGVGFGLEIFMGLLIAGSSWPIIWYGFDQVHESLVSTQTDQFGAKCLELLLTLFKGLSPAAFAIIAVKSPAGRVVGKAAQATITAGRWSGSQLINIPGNSSHSFRDIKSISFEKQHSEGRYLSNSKVVKEFGKNDRLKTAKKQQIEKGKEKNENVRSRNSKA